MMTREKAVAAMASVKMIQEMLTNFPEEDPSEGLDIGLLTSYEALRMGGLRALAMVRDGIIRSFEQAKEADADGSQQFSGGE